MICLVLFMREVLQVVADVFWLCYVLAAEETATDEYRFELQPFCNHFHQIYSFMNYFLRKSLSSSLIII